MRKQLLLLRASYPILSLVLLCCLLSLHAHAQMAYDADQVFLSGIAFCFPQSKDIVTDITALKHNCSVSLKYPYLLYPTDKQADNSSISAAYLKNIDSLYMAGVDIDSIDSKETVAIAAMNNVTIDKLVKDNQPTKMDGSALFDTETDMLVTKYAGMIGQEPEEVENFPLYKFIDQWFGVKYKFGGTDNTGIDCSAFSQKLYSSIYSIPLQRTAREQHRHCEKIKDAAEAMEGDLVFFRIHRFRISHVGVYLANGFFVHASRSRGVTISNLSDRYWQRRYAGCGRVSKDNTPATESDYLQ